MRTLTFAILAMLAFSQASAEVAKRGLRQSDAFKIGAQLFPEFCGPKGDRCGYGFYGYRDGRDICPFDLWVELPETALAVGWPKVLWVGLDERKRPIAMATHTKYAKIGCAKRDQDI